MTKIKQIRNKMKERGVIMSGGSWLKVGEKVEGGGVKSTGKHYVKLVEEPTIITGKQYYTGIERQELLLTLEEDGKTKKWSTPLYKLDEKGNAVKSSNGKVQEHYLIPDLEYIDIGDEFSMELKSNGKKKFVQITTSDKKDEVERDEVDDDFLDYDDFLDDDNEEISIDDLGEDN